MDKADVYDEVWENMHIYIGKEERASRDFVTRSDYNKLLDKVTRLLDILEGNNEN